MMTATKNNWDIVRLYDDIASRSSLGILSSGRYLLNSFGYRKKLAADIAQKMSLSSSDAILDLGCNVGIYHRYLAPKVKAIVGVDGAPTSVEKAKALNKFPNVHYTSFDILKEWPEVPSTFNKVLVYSVIHFFDSLDDIRTIFQLALQANSHVQCVFFGEVRTIEQYDRFLAVQKEKTKVTWRDRKFALNKWISKQVLGQVKGYPCKSFASADLIKIGEEFGFRCTVIPQQTFHPFYNTCSDFLFSR
jgi:SAM-dependent methyltransferase